MVDWNEVINESVLALLKILIPILVTFIVKWAIQLWAQIKESNPSLARMLVECAMIGYHAAEDYAHNNPDVHGSDKMEYAIHVAGDYLKEVYDQIASEETLRSAIATYGSDEGLFSWVETEHDDDSEDRFMGFPVK